MSSRAQSPADFHRFWFGQTISFLGSEVTGLALPLTAVVVLHATSAQMGLLTASRLRICLIRF